MISFELAKYPLTLLGAFLLSSSVLPAVKRLSLAVGAIDTPGSRRIHSGDIPRLGGIAIYLSFLAVSALIMEYSSFYGGSLKWSWWTAFFVSSTFLFLLGILDDIYELKAVTKLLGQIAASMMLIDSGVSIDAILSFTLPEVLNLPFSVLWFLVFINAFNLIDGMDGLAAGIASITITGLIGISLISGQPANTLVLLALLGASLGFLRHNFHPATIFLGDSGSMFLGFSLAAISLESGTKSTTITALAATMLAFGVPLFDTILAIWRRSVRRYLFKDPSKGLMSADMDHLHHRLVRMGMTQRKVALTLYGISAALVLLGLLSMAFRAQALAIYLVAFTIGTYVVVRHLARVELWDSGRALITGLSRPSTGVLASLAYPFIDFLLLIFALAISNSVLGSFQDWSGFKRTLLNDIPIWCSVTFIALALSGTYSRVWSKARISEFAMLILALGAGVVLATAIALSLESDLLALESKKAILFFGFAGAFTCGVRAFPRLIQDLMSLSERHSFGEADSRRKLLIIGTEVSYLRFLKRDFVERGDFIPPKVIGLIDDDRNLRKRIIHGYRVLGTTSELDQVLEENPIDEIIITGKIDLSKVERIVLIARKRQIVVKEWRTFENKLFPQEWSRSDLAEQIEIQTNSSEDLTKINFPEALDNVSLRK
jgi:UDP-N-acetylmuramyl pentapeptide phosphotransferase/UDP-N-acetylglucosamine-1-phosphate transferase